MHCELRENIPNTVDLQKKFNSVTFDNYKTTKEKLW